MDGLREKALELASQDAEFAERLSAAETPEEAAGLLREKGLDITAEDLRTTEQPGAAGAARLSDDELEAVAGGDQCLCVTGGGGSGDAGGVDRTCACVLYGIGYYQYPDQPRKSRCQCFNVGSGDYH